MSKQWILEGYFNSGEQLQRVALSDFPAQVGRNPAIAVAIVQAEVSRVHAEFLIVGNDLVLRDLNSTNGSFINHQRLTGEKIVRHGDIVHFANYEVRVLAEQSRTNTQANDMTEICVEALASKLPVGLNALQVLLDERAIQAQFQPIVDCNGTLYGYEILGRGNREDLPHHPMELFRIAESMPGKDVELSVLMRDCGVEQAFAQAPTARLFMNTHPAELRDIDALLQTMVLLRKSFLNIPMVLEIHEDAVTNVGKMKAFAEELMTMDIELAYDDFGAGQGRLMEMIEVPVRYVKFDIALIRGLHAAPEAKQKMVTALADMTRSMGIQALAEGVEAKEDLAMCRKMHFDLIQGYHFGKPKPHLNYSSTH